MTGQSYDAVVIGLGAMGSAALYHLARRGQRVIGFEQFGLGHGMGSSHGLTRLLRVAYAEGALYVPIVQRARQLWMDLGAAAGEALFVETGSLDIGPADRGQVPDAVASCRSHGLRHDVLDAAEIMRRHPAWRLPNDKVGLFQPEGGFVRSEAAILAHVGLAVVAGADVATHTPVIDVRQTGAGTVEVRTRDACIEAGQAIVCAGAWIGRLIPSLAAQTVVKRIPIGWFATRQPDLFQPERFPIWTLEAEEGAFYGTPLHGHPGVKIGGPSSTRHPEWAADPDRAERGRLGRDEPGLRAALDRYLPAGAGPALTIGGCLVTFTADEHFIIDRVADADAIIAVSACSGHGYKFASAIGEIAADLAMATTPRFDLAPFALARATLQRV